MSSDIIMKQAEGSKMEVSVSLTQQSKHKQSELINSTLSGSSNLFPPLYFRVS